MTHGLPDALSALLQARAYPHPVERIELVETHVSWVLLTGTYAYKIKRPVHYAFIDLRPAERRAFFCREELRLNKRFAPDLYLDVCEIVCRDTEARIGGPGTVIEHAVRMLQFRREDELDRLLAAGRIAASELESFGRSLAKIHAILPASTPEQAWARPQSVRTLILENLGQCIDATALHGTGSLLAKIRDDLALRLDALTSWLSRRQAGGRVRECHGDLHTRNIVWRDGRLLAFDCLEFEPAFRWIDVADEIALLVADLDAQRCPAHANAFLNGYLAQSGDYEACRVLDLYKAHRALIRAKVTALTASDAESCADEFTAARRDCLAHMKVARIALDARQPLLLLMSGLSGAGKTWLATRLAPALGAIHLRSDIERKRLAGLEAAVHSDSALDQGLYAQPQRTAVYEHLEGCAEHVLAGGYSVIVDATFLRRDDRIRFRQLAERLRVPLRFLRCGAPHEVLCRRVEERRARGADASEANLAVLEWQESHAEPVRAEEDLSILDVDTAAADCVPPFPDLVRELLSPSRAAIPNNGPRPP